MQPATAGSAESIAKRVGKAGKRDSKTKLMQMAETTSTALWNDSCSIEELSASIELNGAVGATCNPVIVLSVLKKEWHLWKDRIAQMVREMPSASDEQLAWRLVEEMSVKAARLLEPIFDREKGKNGRLSIQTNPNLFRNVEGIVQQTIRFSQLAPNMIVKIPATSAGIEAMEEATYRGVSINATVSFTLPQAIAVAEAVERGLNRREKEGKDISSMGPICTLMVGRLDDWLRVVAEKENIIVDPWVYEWAGVAVMKKAYRIFSERGYRLRLLSAAFRNHLHWSEFIGGDVVISPPYKWQERYNNSEVEITNHIDTPVDASIIDSLERNFEDFRRAYDERGMGRDEFDEFGATARTLRQFSKATDDLVAVVRDTLIPNPDM
ncbi:MAG TPA: transaldolase family protein [Spirochaetia bacterium]|nr:transaldolase family protein [Spirochaetia bacterium]